MSSAVRQAHQGPPRRLDQSDSRQSLPTEQRRQSPGVLGTVAKVRLQRERAPPETRLRPNLARPGRAQDRRRRPQQPQRQGQTSARHRQCPRDLAHGQQQQGRGLRRSQGRRQSLQEEQSWSHSLQIITIFIDACKNC